MRTKLRKLALRETAEGGNCELLQLRLWQLQGQDLPYAPKLPLVTAAAASTAFPSSRAAKRTLGCSCVAFPSPLSIDSAHNTCPLCSRLWPALRIIEYPELEGTHKNH